MKSFEILNIEKSSKEKMVSSLRTMLPYVIDTTAFTAIYKNWVNDDLLSAAWFVIIPCYLCGLTSLYGITYLKQLVAEYKKNNYSKTL